MNTFLPQRRKGATREGRNAAALCAVAPLREKFFFKGLVAIVAAFTAILSVAAQTREQRLAKLVEANVIAVHAFQVLLAKSSGKGRECFSANTVWDAELNALSEHQAKLLQTDIKQLRLWVNGRASTFNPEQDLQPILATGLKIPDNAPVNVFTRYLRQNTRASEVNIRAVASLYQTVLEVERDGDRLQEEFAFYIGLSLPVYVGQFKLPGSDEDLLAVGRKLEGQSCEAPVGTSAAEWQIAWDPLESTCRHASLSIL